MSEKAPTNTATPEMVPAFGVPNQWQEGHIKSDLYGDTINRADTLPAMPGTESIADGASRSLALHGNETGIDSTDGISRSVELPGLKLEIGGLDSAGPSAVDASLSERFVFAKTDPTDPNSPTKRVKVTEITLKPGEGSLRKPDLAPFIPLYGRKKGKLSADKTSRSEEPQSYMPNEQASEIRVTLLDGKPANVSWMVPDSERRGPNGLEKVSGTTSIPMELMPELRANRERNYGNGEATLVEDILNATSQMFKSTEANDNVERDQRMKTANNVARVALNTQVSIDNAPLPF
jgi:hypothetical protein